MLCLGGDGGSYELVGVGFDDDEARFFAGYFFDEQVGGFVEAAFEGAEGAGCGVPAADGAVVGVGDCDGSVGQFGQAEGVLHAGGVGVAVDEAEVEQALADGGGDLYAVFGEGDVAQAAGFGACDPEAAVAGFDDAGGLSEPCVGGRSVGESFDAGACEDADDAVDGVVAEELVGACHGDDELAGFAGVDGVPGRGERDFGGGYAGGDVVGVAGDGVVAVDDALHAVTCEGAYFAGAQVERAQAVVDGVSYQHVVAELFAQVFGYEGEAGGFVEACFGAGAVDVALDGVVDGVVAAAVGVDDGVEVGCYLQDAVACAVCDEVGAFAVAEEVCGAEFGGQFDGFAGEGVSAGCLGAGHVGAVAAVQGAFRFVFCDEFAYEGGEALYVAFAGEVGDDVAFGVDDDEGGPCAGGVCLPGGQFGVVEYGVGDVVAVDGCGERYGVCFVFEFGAVYADGDEYVGEFFFEGA